MSVSSRLHPHRRDDGTLGTQNPGSDIREAFGGIQAEGLRILAITAATLLATAGLIWGYHKAFPTSKPTPEAATKGQAAEVQPAR